MEHIHRESSKPSSYLSTRHRAFGQDSKRQACDTCKRRKVRCSGGIPCQNCERAGNPCRYDSPHGKLSIAESRIARCEDRIRLMEAAWQRFVPSVELDYALRIVAGLPLDSDSQTPDTQDGLSHDRQGSTSSTKAPNPLEAEPENDPSDPITGFEGELHRADALEWDESADLAALADGIGSLSVNPKGTGYMGPQSGNALLRYLQSMSTFLQSSQDEFDYFPHETPTSDVPDDVLMSTAFSNDCVNWYFKHFNSAYPILHEGFFRAQLMGALPKPKDGSWPVLLNMVLAVGAFTGEASDQNADFHFFRIAWQHLSMEILQRGSLTLVQAILLMANYLQKRDKPNSGFTLLGVAVNMAQGIGLHREFATTTVDPFTMEIRRRVWWTLFIFDSGARLTFGRPTMSLGGVNIQLPRNLEDNDLSVDLDDLPPPRETVTTTSCLIWQSKLAKLSNIANEKMLEAKSGDKVFILDLNQKIDVWRRELPPYLGADSDRGQFEVFYIPRMVLLWRSMHLRIVIHRQFILDIIGGRKPLDLSNTNDPASKCVHAAQECILSIIGVWNTSQRHPGALVWYSCYWLVTAVFVLVTCLVYDPYHTSAPSWRQMIESSRLILDHMGDSELTALRAARILSKVVDLVPYSPDPMTFEANEPVRLGVADLWSQSWTEAPVPQEDYPLFLDPSNTSYYHDPTF